MIDIVVDTGKTAVRADTGKVDAIMSVTKIEEA